MNVIRRWFRQLLCSHCWMTELSDSHEPVSFCLKCGKWKVG